ncbi:MAG: D-alanyl-D-alanine carboxypeptidase [Xanthomonadaceae bacterium]|nr:D-alanyl-D-alanine carboxypeptidase [Xanthomonadaceae bacterium]
MFTEFAKKLKESGVTLIRGPVVVEASDPRFDDEVIPPGNLDENLVWCFGAQPASFNIDQNCGLVAVTSLIAGSWFDSGFGQTIRVELEAEKTNDFEITREGDGYFISGTANLATFPTYLDLRVLRPIDRAHSLFQNVLIAEAISFTIELGETSEVEVKSCTHFSEPLSEIIKPIVKSSLNQPLEALQRALVKEGAKVITEFLSTEIKTTSRLPVFVDGSGLSRSNFINANRVYDFLIQMKSKTYFDSFLKALSVGGEWMGP